MAQKKETYLLGRKAIAYYNDIGALFGDVGTGGAAPQDPDPRSAKQIVEDWLDADDQGGTYGKTQIAGNVVDVTLNINSEYADGTTRETAATGFASSIPVLRGGEVTFEARWKPEDPYRDPQQEIYSFTKVLMDAWKEDKTVAVAFLDKSWFTWDYDASAPAELFICQGLAANFTVSLNKTEALRDVQRKSVSLTIADSALWFVSDIRQAQAQP